MPEQSEPNGELGLPVIEDDKKSPSHWFPPYSYLRTKSSKDLFDTLYFAVAIVFLLWAYSSVSGSGEAIVRTALEDRY